jgi:DNA-directed RNA polymerase subunit M/transcription elongation factor TFIIS
MSQPVYYVQECPTCGRRLQIRVAHLGKQVVCQHCLAEFMACDPANKQLSCSDSSQDLLARAEELLATVDRQQESKAEWVTAEGF